jgi:hypothetical protein
MLKMIGAVVRRPGVSHEALIDAWEHIHAPHITRVARPERYRLTFFEPDDSPLHPGLDGMAELWFRDADHFRATMTAEAGPELVADGFGDYADYTRVSWYPTTEYVNVDGQTTRTMTKLVFFAQRKEGVARDEFQRIWREVHIPNVAASVRRTPGACRYTVSLVNAPEDLAYDGIAQIWFEEPGATLGDLVGLERDEFSDVMGTIHVCRSHEVIIIPPA